MYRSLSIALALICAAALLVAAQTTQGTEKFSGTWAGTYAGDGSGKFEMTLTPAADGKHTGKLSSTSDEGETMTLELKSATFADDKMTAKFAHPGSEVEATMEGTFTGASASGNWSYGSSASGTWKASKK